MTLRKEVKKSDILTPSFSSLSRQWMFNNKWPISIPAEDSVKKTVKILKITNLHKDSGKFLNIKTNLKLFTIFKNQY